MAVPALMWRLVGEVACEALTVKVLHVIPSVSAVHGGPTNALAMMERGLSALGVTVATLTTDDDGRKRRLAEASQPRGINGAKRFYARKWSEFYKFAPGLFPWLLRNGRDYDVVHIHALFSFSTLVAAWVARAKGIPYVVRPLGTLSDYGIKQRRRWLKAASLWMIESKILSHASAVHFTSQQEWDEAQTLGIRLRGVVIPLGVERVSSIQATPPPFKVEKDQLVVLFLSRLDPKKNVEGLIRAFGEVRRCYANAVLVISGDGPPEYVLSLKALAAAEGIAGAVIWTGYIEGEPKWATFAAADVFVLPSFSENFGIAAVEALTAGRACVLGRGVAVAAMISGAGAGISTETDPPAIASALKKLLGDRALRQEMGASGKALAMREYDSSNMAKRLSELYSGIVESRHSSRLARPVWKAGLRAILGKRGEGQ